jgi:uncharacterized protein (UPF0305 family)
MTDRERLEALRAYEDRLFVRMGDIRDKKNISPVITALGLHKKIDELLNRIARDRYGAQDQQGVE